MTALTDAIELALSEARATEADLAARITELGASRQEITRLNADLAAARARITELEAQLPTNEIRYLSDLTPAEPPVNGWGPYARDRANGEQGANDGPPLRLRGITYAKGLGVHARSALVYNLGGHCARFRAVIGIDDYVPAGNTTASVTFRVLGDGVAIYTSPVLTRSGAAVNVDVPVAGVNRLRLEVNEGASTANDHADWANAHLTFATTAMLNQFLLLHSAGSGTTPPPPPVAPTIGTVSASGGGQHASGAAVTLTAARSGNASDIAWSWQVPAGSGVTPSTSATQSFTMSAGAAGTFTATATSATASDSPRSGQASITLAAAPDSTLGLSAAPWYGGHQYWAQFPVAAQTEWATPEFFPICVFYGKPEHAPQLKARGINTYLRAENPSEWANVNIMTNEGLYLILQTGWEPSQLGSNPNRVIGWMASEEVEMYGPGDCTGKLNSHMSEVNRRRAYNDGRFLQANYGNGVLMTHWCPTIMDDLVASVDTSSCDKYAYTSPHVRDWLFPNTPAWNNQYGAGAFAGRSIAYGWQQRQMQSIGLTLNGSPTNTIKPSMVFVETAMPFLFNYQNPTQQEPGARTIDLEEMEGAVWNTLIYGAAGVLWFQHNNDYANGGTYSIVQWNTPERPAKVQAINEQVLRMAPVLNSQPLVWNFGANIESRLSVQGGYAWIIAMGNGSGGSRTFTLPPALASATTVTVFEEGRTLTVTGGQFTDSFAAEHEHHIYRISIA
jgi:hypothetical protein